jgi:hypothetical protein
MKTKLSIILSIISIVGVLSIWGLWLFGTMKLSVVSLDTFIGVIVALLAIIFTVIIGWQIINTIEIRNWMSQIEQKQNIFAENERKLTENDQLHTLEAYNLHAAICQTDADSYKDKGQYIEAFTFYHVALCYSILSGTPNQLSRINQLNQISQCITAPPIANYKMLVQQIKSDSNRIRATTSYRNCLSEVYEQTMQAFWQKIKLLGLEVPE